MSSTPPTSMSCECFSVFFLFDLMQRQSLDHFRLIWCAFSKSRDVMKYSEQHSSSLALYQWLNDWIKLKCISFALALYLRLVFLWTKLEWAKRKEKSANEYVPFRWFISFAFYFFRMEVFIFFSIIPISFIPFEYISLDIFIQEQKKKKRWTENLINDHLIINSR